MLDGINLTALNENAKTGTIPANGENETAYFSFPKHTVSELNRRKFSPEGVSVCISIKKIEVQNEGNFYFSFLYENDLNKDGTIKDFENLSKRGMVRGNFSASEKDFIKYAKQKCRIRMC